VEKAVLHEYHQTYLKNKDVAGVTFSNDRGVYQFLEEVYALPHNNVITPFDSARDIISSYVNNLQECSNTSSKLRCYQGKNSGRRQQTAKRSCR
jgi:hypothetical protein